MKPVLVIGSTVTDVILHIEQLPKSQESINTISHSWSLGGCAYNVAEMLRYCHVPMVLYTPVGTGPHGEFVAGRLKERGIPVVLPTEEENGCCYCLVDRYGERTFISNHGAEYLFKKQWFDLLNPDDYQAIYVCGLELEEDKEKGILEFLKRSRLPVYFAVGPRIQYMDKEYLKELLSLNPILHLNEEEAYLLADMDKSNKLFIAAEKLFDLCHNTVVITCGSKGVYFKTEKDDGFICSRPLIPVDTIGAGDGHCGVCIAYLSQKKDIREVLHYANEIAGRITQVHGSVLL